MNVFLLLLVLVIAAALLWRRGSYAYALLAAAMAVLPAWALVRQLPWWAYLIAGLLVAAAGWHHLSRSAALITRWTGRTRRSAGTASSSTIARRASGRALRAKVRKVRPSLAELGRWALWRVPTAEYGIELCRTGLQTVWASVEDVTLVFGGPRTGKTGWLAGRIIDAPGAVVVTSTRTDLLDLCGPLREKKGPVWVFNAVGLGGIASTVTFDPLTGCTDPETAAERATDMIAAVSKAGSGDREFWDAQARRALGMLLHAAALSGRPMDRILTWIADPEIAKREVSAALQLSPVKAFSLDAAQFLGTNSKTQTSITTTMTLALGWLNNPSAAAAAAPGHGFDVAELLAQRATVFLLGAEEVAVAPLMCALTGHIAREARRIASDSPSGRLDPPLGLYLDEAFLICPVPLESWSADMGGRNVTIIAVFQSRQQMLDRYGAAKTGQIMTNAAAKVIFGGTGDRDDLMFWSTLCGDRDEWVTSTDIHGRTMTRSVRSVPVLAPAQITNLPAGRVLVLRREINPVIGRARMAWHRTDVHDVHHPGALTVRARAWRRRQVAGATCWIGDRTRPARAWMTSKRGAATRWCSTRWTAARVRVTGHGGPVSYLNPRVVPGHVVPAAEPPPPTPTLPGGEVIPFPPPQWAPRPLDDHHPDRQHGGPDDDALNAENDDPWGETR